MTREMTKEQWKRRAISAEHLYDALINDYGDMAAKLNSLEDDMATLAKAFAILRAYEARGG